MNCKQTAALQNDLLVDQDRTSENDVEWVIFSIVKLRFKTTALNMYFLSFFLSTDSSKKKMCQLDLKYLLKNTQNT